MSEIIIPNGPIGVRWIAYLVPREEYRAMTLVLAPSTTKMPETARFVAEAHQMSELHLRVSEYFRQTGEELLKKGK